jgi:hypothetical protein
VALLQTLDVDVRRARDEREHRVPARRQPLATLVQATGLGRSWSDHALGKEAEMGLRREPAEDGHRIQQLLGLVWVGLVVAAVVKELRTPSEERTWHGVVAGFVPYDFRVPTVARLRERVWAPEDEHLLNPHPFGVGWTLNAGRAVSLVQQRFHAG